MEYTDWYDHDLKPVHVGVYEIENINTDGLRYFVLFNGEYFGFAVWSDDGIIDVEKLYSKRYEESHMVYTWTNSHRWRGVKEQTKF